MRALPINDTTRAGGRPRKSRAPHNKWAEWLLTCGMQPSEVAAKLTAILVKMKARARGRPVSTSSVYNMRNAYFRPGRDMALAIEELTTPRGKHAKPAVPVSAWPSAELRTRPGSD